MTTDDPIAPAPSLFAELSAPRDDTAGLRSDTAEEQVDIAEPPAYGAELPADTAEPPANTAQPPANTAESPADITEPPADTIEPPADTIEPPANTAEPPAETIEPPAGTTEPPANTAEPPADTVEPPADTAPLRARLLAQFEQWLDQMLAEQPPPRGLPDNLLAEAMAEVSGQQISGQTGQDTDRYTLFSSLTALTGEIRLQGRAFKQLSDLLSPVAQLPPLLAQMIEAQSESAHLIEIVANQTQPEASHVQFKQVCEVMIDLFDRLQRGLQTCDEGIQSLQSRRRDTWLRRLVGAAEDCDQAALGVQAIADAVALTLARLESVLREWGVARIGKVGEPFDPDRMSAIEVRADPDSPAGTVLAVQRSGYALNGILKATAQVTVSKAVN